MIGLVMAGGCGSRMDIDDEKLLLCFKKPLVMHVIDALNDSTCFHKVFAITSPNSPKTRNYLQENDIATIQTPGAGFAKDLNDVLCKIDDPVLVVSGDLPFLDGQIIAKIIAKYNPDNVWTSFVVTREFFESLGLTSEFSVSFKGHDCIYTGISLINAKHITDQKPIAEKYIILDDKKIAFNVNTSRDYELFCTT